MDAKLGSVVVIALAVDFHRGCDESRVNAKNAKPVESGLAVAATAVAVKSVELVVGWELACAQLLLVTSDV